MKVSSKVKGVFLGIFLFFLFLGNSFSLNVTNNVTQSKVPRTIAALESKDNDPQKGLVKEIMDDFISNFDDFVKDTEMQLDIDRNYKVFGENGNYVIRFNNLRLVNRDRKDNYIDFSPTQIKFKIISDKAVAIDFLFPKRIPIIAKKKEEGVFSVKDYHFSGDYLKDLRIFQRVDINLIEPLLRDANSTLVLSLDKIDSHYNIISNNVTKVWNYNINGELRNFNLKIKDDNNTEDGMTIGNISFLSHVSGKNLEEVIEAKRTLSDLFKDPEKISVKEIKNALNSLEILVNLINGGSEKVKISKFLMKTQDGMSLGTDNITFESKLRKFANTREFEADSNTKVESVYLNMPKSKEPSLVKNGKFKELNFVFKFKGRQFPKGFFNDLGERFEKVSDIKDEKKRDTLLSQYLNEILHKLLSLINSANTEMKLSGLDVTDDNATKTIALSSLWISGGFDGKGHGNNSLRLATGYSGLFSGFFDKYFKAANLHLKLQDIPSILEFIDDKSFLKAKRSPDAIKTDLTAKFLTRLQKKPIILYSMASILGVPQSLFNVDLMVKSDPKAKFKATGSLDVKIENPDNFMAIFTELFGNSGASQILAMVSAFGERKEMGEKVVESLNIKITPNGKIFMNNKDVTNMFFPEKKPAKKGALPKKEKM